MHQGLTHQSVGLSLGHNDEETWDLSDSLADLYQAVTRKEQKAASRLKSHTVSRSTGQSITDGNTVDIQRWLDDDTNNGFIRVFTSDTDPHARLFPCTVTTPAQKICLQLAIPGNSLHVQLSGDVIRRMEPVDCPLAIQNDYLAGLGYRDIRYIQEAGPKEDLAFLVRFYSGKPLSLSDFTYSRNHLSTYAYIRKGKLLHQWVRRLCVISGTRMLIHREKGTEPTVVQLARGAVEEVTIKGQSLVLKITSTHQGERSMYMSFVSQDDYNKWFKKIKKATAKLPSRADLSNCHLEFLPETVFINSDLDTLILRHNALKERPIEEDIYTIGWLDDLPRFTGLRSLNLADNQLTSFPASLCQIRSLMELNLASNKLDEIPAQIAELTNLQILHLHNNRLTSLPEELTLMKKLAVVVLAFNKFSQIPTLLLQPKQALFLVDSIIMAGNHITRLPPDQLAYMARTKKIDLRLNQLQIMPAETVKFQSLEHVTHVDIRDNQVTELDFRSLRCLEYLNCDRNLIKTMQLNGSALKHLYAAHNFLQSLMISPKPEWVVNMDISYNKLIELPAWLSDCFFLLDLNVSHNSLKALPERLFTDATKLKNVRANHNHLTQLPDKIRSDTLEELHLQHNGIKHLSTQLFIMAHRLRYLNMTRNKLCDLPAPNKNDSYNKLQELYLSFNLLGNECLHKICCFPRLRVLHLAKNKLTVLEETDIEKLEQLTELNISGNILTYLPAALGRHPKLQVLRANCNLLQELPAFKNSSALKVLEVSSNHLVKVNMTNLMSSQIAQLDISANPNIELKSHDVQAAISSKKLSMVDIRGQNCNLDELRSQGEINDEHLWQTGLSQTSGIRNKLSVSAINKPQFGEPGEGLFAIFDGGRNEVVSSLLRDVIPLVLAEERIRSKRPEVYLKYSFLSAHRNLKHQGQKLGAAAVVVHLHKDDRGSNILSVANVGDSQAVLYRQKRAHVLSRPFLVAEDKEDTKRVVSSGGIITEDGRIAGVTTNTRLLGCSYLYPYVIPDPHVTSTVLTPDDNFVIIANQGLWQFVSYDEAAREIKDCPDPVIAAKHLQDLAQGYGSRENIAVLVIRLMLTQGERLKIKDMMRAQRKSEKEQLKVLTKQEDILQFRDGVPKVEELNGVIIDRSGHAKKHKGNRTQLLESGSLRGSPSNEEVGALPGSLGNVFPEALMADRKSSLRHKSSLSTSDENIKVDDKRLYRKKGSSYSSKDNMLQKRNMEENSGPVVDNNQTGAKLSGVPSENSGTVSDDQQTGLKQGFDAKSSGSSMLGAATEVNDSGTDGEAKRSHRRVNLPRLNIPEARSSDDVDDDPYNKLSPNGGFNVSPTESISSIDTRIYYELDELYRFRNSTVPLGNELNDSSTSEADLILSPEIYTRPLSPDSIISQDEFVKPFVSSANIDRDALLFHQMQMARAQAHGSTASLDSIQSAPMHASRRDIFPAARTSSHSIEVLVNLGVDVHLTDSMRDGRVVWGSSLGDLNSTKNMAADPADRDSPGEMEDDDQGTLVGSDNDIGNLQDVCSDQEEGESDDLVLQGRGQQESVWSPERSQQESVWSPERGPQENVWGPERGQQENVWGPERGQQENVWGPERGQQENVWGPERGQQENVWSPERGQQESVWSPERKDESDDDSDSDDSIGNVSLEDGYSAMEFSRALRKESLSLMNMLDIDQAQHSLRRGAGSGKYQAFITAGRSSGSRSNVYATVAEVHAEVPRKKVNSDYEDIDNVRQLMADQHTHSQSNADNVDTSPNNTHITDTKKAENNSAEVDIDQLYTKLNKIKRDNINDKQRESTKIKDKKRSYPVATPHNDTAEASYDKNNEGADSVIIVTGGRDGEETVLPRGDGLPQHLMNAVNKSGFIHQPVHDSIKSLQQTRPPAIFKRASTNSAQLSSSPTPSSAKSFKSSPPMCNTPIVTATGLVADTSLDVADTSLDVADTTVDVGQAYNMSFINQENYPEDEPPPLPPKPHERLLSQLNNDYITPMWASGQHINRAPPIPPRRSIPSPKQSPRPLPRHHLPKAVNTNVLDFDESVLSAHELYPDSHQPLSSQYSSTTSVSSAANKLASQRSIIITYL
ncbi:uncharacterized protein LOC131947287 isoform X2 [Physella acuta]|nr:uncharacterized protein LOC131947287 isoform X2 [Physella acuta]